MILNASQSFADYVFYTNYLVLGLAYSMSSLLIFVIHESNPSESGARIFDL